MKSKISDRVREAELLRILRILFVYLFSLCFSLFFYFITSILQSDNK